MKTKVVFGLLALALVLTAVLGGLFLVKQRQEIRPKAASEIGNQCRFTLCIPSPTGGPRPSWGPPPEPTPILNCQDCDVTGDGCFGEADTENLSKCYGKGPDDIDTLELNCSHWDVNGDSKIDVVDLGLCAGQCDCEPAPPVEPTATPTPTSAPSAPEPTATPTPTPTLPEAGMTLPTLTAALAGLVLIVTSLLLIL